MPESLPRAWQQQGHVDVCSVGEGVQCGKRESMLTGRTYLHDDGTKALSRLAAVHAQVVRTLMDVL
eukprot:883607-Prymnesium_polylepis.1